MPVDPIFNELRPDQIILDNLFLDPNNPRLDSSRRERYDDDRITDEDVQAETEEELVDRFLIRRLESNIKTNGFLPIDRIIVREFDTDKFVVLEGNRRICAAKRLWRSNDFNPDIRDSLESIACLVYTGTDTKAAWLFQGLRHISAFVDWGAFQKAKLLAEQVDEDNLSLTDVGNRFGITPHGAGQWLRAYRAFCQARDESEYVDVVDDELYPFMQELFSRTSYPLRQWMKWDEDDQRFADDLAFNEFLSWFYPNTADDPDDTPEYDWESRFIRKRDDIRSLAYLYTKDRIRFEQFRNESDVELDDLLTLSRAERYAKEQEESIDRVKELFEHVSTTTKLLSNAPIKIWKDEELLSEFRKLLLDLDKTVQTVKE